MSGARVVVEQRPVVAYVLDLFGEAPRAVRAWRPTFYQWTVCGVPVPPTDDAIRQATLLRADTVEAP